MELARAAVDPGSHRAVCRASEQPLKPSAARQLDDGERLVGPGPEAGPANRSQAACGSRARGSRWSAAASRPRSSHAARSESGGGGESRRGRRPSAADLQRSRTANAGGTRTACERSTATKVDDESRRNRRAAGDATPAKRCRRPRSSVLRGRRSTRPSAFPTTTPKGPIGRAGEQDEDEPRSRGDRLGRSATLQLAEQGLPKKVDVDTLIAWAIAEAKRTVPDAAVAASMSRTYSPMATPI